MINALTQKYCDKIEITSARCLGAFNKSDSFLKVPYVSVVDEIASSTGLEKITKVIESK